MVPQLSECLEVVDNAWPAHRSIICGPWSLREGRGRGKQVSAASFHQKIDIRDISITEKGMREIGQDPLFMIRARGKKLD